MQKRKIKSMLMARRLEALATALAALACVVSWFQTDPRMFSMVIGAFAVNLTMYALLDQKISLLRDAGALGGAAPAEGQAT
ncbi:MAG: hypothetical protein KBE65_17495 [Phycisphaerae bacterium]|nr:hypothetical protein [Phycisphaerae bacterium]